MLLSYFCDSRAVHRGILSMFCGGNFSQCTLGFSIVILALKMVQFQIYLLAETSQNLFPSNITLVPACMIVKKQTLWWIQVCFILYLFLSVAKNLFIKSIYLSFYLILYRKKIFHSYFSYATLNLKRITSISSFLKYFILRIILIHLFLAIVQAEYYCILCCVDTVFLKRSMMLLQ